jgi:ABC-2 type transport system ATP-binding protein
MTSPIVHINAVSKAFGGQPVLQGLDWRIAPGKVIGLLGRNGAGKSTLIECVLGLREPDAGGITLFGEPAGALSEAARARIGYVPQQSDLYEWLTPLQMLEYFKVLYPRWNDAKVQGLMQRWGFGPDLCNKQIGRLSGGEKQRLSIVRALAHEPELLVLDEPVASLDPVGRRDFLRELVEGVIERDTTVIFSTHILSDLERVALDLAFLKDGRIELQAPLDELLESARRITGSAAAMQDLRVTGEIRRQRDSDGNVSVLARLSAAEASALGAAHPVRIDTLGLEDLFVEVSQ